MARKTKPRSPSPVSETGHDDQDLLTKVNDEIDPYAVLSLEKTATQDQVKSAYRKAALKHHPDKAGVNDRDEAHKKFQEIAFAYAILSDERRRKRYDTTGNTAESLDGDDFDWVDFFREQTQAMVSADMIDEIKREYQGSEEEKADILGVYEEYQGDMDAIYENIMCSNVLEDDKRFRKIVDNAIKAGTVEEYTTYTQETTASKKERNRKAKREESEAMELAEELGVKDKLFGTGKKKKAVKNGGDEDTLKALIQQRQQNRSENFFDNLEAKYGGGGGTTKKSKRKLDEPPEALFQQNAKKSKSRKS